MTTEPEDDTIKQGKGADTRVSLSRLEKKNIGFLVLAFSCVVACLTLILGTGAVILISVGGSPSLAPFAVAIVFMGVAIVSLTASHWIFARHGRKIGFWVGSGLGCVGSALGGLGLVQTSPAIVLVAQAFLGGAAGIGMYLRFAAVEVVHPEFASRAVTWVLAGGCLAAFVGPEIAQVMVGMFGEDENLTYVGIFIAQGAFFILEGLCVAVIEFPDHTESPLSSQRTSSDDSKPENSGGSDEEEQGEVAPVEEAPSKGGAGDLNELCQVVKSREFIFPLVAAILSWALMAMPMAMFRVPMKELGFSDRQSLTVIEVQTLSRYFPGFWSGKFIKDHGVVRACKVAVLCFAVGLAINLAAQDNSNSTAAWHLGAVFLGVGWNFGFSSATVWSTKAYENHMHLKAQIQAANECGMFLVSGLMIFTTGYVYEDAGGGGLPGWRLLNGALFVLVLFYGLTLVAAVKDSAHFARPVDFAEPTAGTEQSHSMENHPGTETDKGSQ